MYAIKIKREVQNSILKLCKRHREGCDVAVVVADLSLFTGFKKETILDILDDLKLTGKIRTENGQMYEVEND